MTPVLAKYLSSCPLQLALSKPAHFRLSSATALTHLLSITESQSEEPWEWASKQMNQSREELQNAMGR